MKLIVGLGNPEIKYYFTRHNIGFAVIDALLDDLGNVQLDNEKFKGVFTKTKISNCDVIIAKPLTYMNLSGEFIRPLMDFYKIEPKDLLVCYDELALNLGRIKITKTGSAGGHNGIKSIIQNLGTEDFMKLRIGMGPQDKHIDLVDFVLKRMTKEENDILLETYKTAVSAIKCLCEKDIDEVMNLFNRKS